MDVNETSGGRAAEGPEGLAAYLKGLSNGKRLHLLRYLAQPHYLEEIASELGVARQSAQEHVQQLVDLGLVQTIRGRREHGPVTDYVVVPQRLFSVQEQFGAMLGVVDSEWEEKVDLRMPTAPLVSGAAKTGEEDLPRLAIVHGMRIGHVSVLQGQGPWLVGRDPHALLCLDYDPYVSTRHAEIRRGESGFELADLYSSNGTHVDWKRMERGSVRKLENGSLLRFGRTLVLFRRPGK